MLIAQSDICDLHPVAFFHPRQKVTMSADEVSFWRQNLRDGYTGSAACCYVTLTPHVIVALNPAVFVAGKFLQQTALPARNVAFVNLGFTYRF